jgi:hypothetical protein
MNTTRKWTSRTLPALGVLMLSLPAMAQNQAGQTATGVVNQAGQTAGQVTGQLGNTAGNVVGQAGQAVGGVVGGLQPTLQPVGEGVGGALNNLTQPQTVQSLLEFLASVVPNHIEAHVNLDALRVDKLTVDIRGVDLRNLRVDLLVANSRGGGQVRPVLGQNTGNNTSGATSGTGPSLTGASGSGTDGFNYNYNTAPGGGSTGGMNTGNRTYSAPNTFPGTAGSR